VEWWLSRYTSELIDIHSYQHYTTAKYIKTANPAKAG